MFLMVRGNFIENYIIKISEGKCNFKEKTNYASNFDEKHLTMYINLPVHGHIQKFTKETVLMPPWLVKKSKNK